MKGKEENYSLTYNMGILPVRDPVSIPPPNKLSRSVDPKKCK